MPDKSRDDEPIKPETSESGEADSQAEDTEGHFMLPDTGAARILASRRSSEIERDVRIRVQKKDSRPNTNRGR